jgi:hypothetical protein
LRGKSQEKQTKDFAPSSNKNNFFRSNQRFQRERGSLSPTLPEAPSHFSEASLPAAQRHALRGQHDAMRMNETSPTNVNFGTLMNKQPIEPMKKPSMQFSTRYRGRGHSRPGELGFLTHSDKSLINEIQGYIQSKGLNRHHPGMRTTLFSPKQRTGDAIGTLTHSLLSPMASLR